MKKPALSRQLLFFLIEQKFGNVIMNVFYFQYQLVSVIQS